MKEIAMYINELEERTRNTQKVKYDSKYKTYFFDLEEINYFVRVPSTRNTIEVFKVNEIMVFNGSMKEIKKLFEDSHFFSDLKSYLINPDNIRVINKSTREVIFKNNDVLILSQRSLAKLNKFVHE